MTASGLAGVEFGVRVEGPAQNASAHGYIEGDDFRLETAPDRQVYAGPSSSVAYQLALLVGLGPRPRPDAESPVLVGELIAEPSRAEVDRLWPEELREGSALEAEDWVLWTAYAIWPETDQDEAGFRSVSVIDGGPAGIAILDGSDEGTELRPCSPTDVWVALCGLLPYPAEREVAA